MKFTKPFKGATGGNPFPQEFDAEDDVPDDLVQAAIEADAVETVPIDEEAVGTVVQGKDEAKKSFKSKKQS